MDDIIKYMLKEDEGYGDITSEALIKRDGEPVEVEEPVDYNILDENLPEYEEPIDFSLSGKEYW